MRVLVFRPHPGADATAADLAARGHEAILSPALNLQPLTPADPRMDGVEMIAVTSAPAAAAAADLARRTNLPLAAVGGATARALYNEGAVAKIIGGKDGAALAEAILAKARPFRVLHVRGKDVTPGLGRTLKEAGVKVRGHVVYAMEEFDALGEEARKALKSRKADAAIFTSPRVAQAAERLLAGAGLADRRAGLDAFAMSEAVAGALERDAWRAVKVPERPRMTELLDLLGDQA